MNRPAAFWDASAIVPVCVREANTHAARQHMRRQVPVVWWGTLVEVHSAVARAQRAGWIDARQSQSALANLQRLRPEWREILPDSDLRDLACELVHRYPLRAADSMQLAAALTWSQERPTGHAFVCNDQRLSEAAEAAGFSVIRL